MRHPTARRLRDCILLLLLFALGLPLHAPAEAGRSVNMVIYNGSPQAASVTFSDRQNCLEPVLVAKFIGKTFRIDSGKHVKLLVARRNGHGCDGKNAVFWGSAAIDGKRYGWRRFWITGDGGMRTDANGMADSSAYTQKQHNLEFVWWLLPKQTRAVTPQQKLAILQQYAPQVWLAKGEPFGPSSVDWAFSQMNRATRHGRYWLYAKQPLGNPSDSSLPLFRGQGTAATAYAYWREKAGGVVDLVYFMFYPYNRGKKLANTVWGNHVGDWENMIVRLDGNLRPIYAFLDAHGSSKGTAWANVSKTDGNHPVVYAAWGSHGMYFRPGNHVYENTALGPLVDSASPGSAWRTWQRLQAFDFDARQGLNTRWPRWMDRDYVVGQTKQPGDINPASGAIWRWGNGENGCGGGLQLYKKASGECRLNDGPTGPIDKTDRWDAAAFCWSSPGTVYWRDYHCNALKR